MSDYLESVRQACLGRCPAMLLEWLPGGRLEGKSYQCGGISGGPGDSLKVNLVKGLWKDWASSQPGGDLVSLYAAVKSLGYKDALRELANQFGITPPSRKARSRVPWAAVMPVPDGVYASGDTGSPLLPGGAFSEEIRGFWGYLDREFNLLFFIVRLARPDGGKRFSWLSYQRDTETGKCSWQKLAPPQPWPLYGLESLGQSPNHILIVEGEKCADAGRRLFPDWCVITWPGGGNNVQNADWSSVRSLMLARIVLWPDNDRPGQSAMSRVAQLLGRDTEFVKVNPSWPKGYDLADLERDAPSDAQKYLTAEGVQHVSVISLSERPEVILVGDPYKDSEAIYAAIAELEADIFYADGPVYIRTNIYGHTEVHPFNARTFAAWAGRRLYLKKYMTRGLVACQLPEPLAEIVLFDSQAHLPHLQFFADTPVFCGGQLLDRSGYNAKAKAYISLPPKYENHMPIEEAWGLAEDLIGDFPFESPSDRTAALCYPLTAIVRHSIVGPTPMFRFEAPAPGTGKTKLCTILSEVICPRLEFYPLPEFEEELQKALTAILMRVPSLTVFDNVEKLGGTSLEQAISGMVWGKRKLGTNENCSVPIHCVWAATLNNPVMKPSIFRRTVRVRLNAGVENPERRQVKWRHPEIELYARENRAKLVAAFVAMAEYGVEQQPGPSVPVMGTFEAWSARLGAISEVNGLPDFLTNLEEDSKLTSDPSAEAVHALVEKWASVYAGSSVQVSDLVRISAGIDGLPVKYVEGRPSPKSFGWMLAKMRGVVIGGCEITSTVGHADTRFYRLVGKQRTLEDEKPSIEF